MAYRQEDGVSANGCMVYRRQVGVSAAGHYAAGRWGKAAAVGALRISPPETASPLARAGSAADAASQPLPATANAKGRVALVSAIVDVFPTAPGMLATQ